MTANEDPVYHHKPIIETLIRIALIAIMAWVDEHSAVAPVLDLDESDNT